MYGWLARPISMRATAPVCAMSSNEADRSSSATAGAAMSLGATNETTIDDGRRQRRARRRR